jgi:hypothetical protein
MPPIIPGEPRYLSNSQVELLLECSWKHKLKYIDDIQEPANDHLIVGSAVHKAVEVFRRAQMEGYLPEWTEEHRNDVIHAELDIEFDKLVHDAEHGYEKDGKLLPPPGLVWTKGVHKENARKLAHKLAETYFYKAAESDIPGTAKVPLAQLETPVGIEEEFYVPIPGTNNWHARGRFDMRTATSLIDLKTAKMRYSQRDMDKKTQPSFYIFSWREMQKQHLAEFRYHLLIKPTPSSWSPASGDAPPESMNAYRAALQSTRRMSAEIDWFGDYLRRQIHQIELGAQVPRQNADYCDYCGVAKHCKPWLKNR